MQRIRKWFVGCGLFGLALMACGLSSGGAVSIEPTATVPSAVEQRAFDGVRTNEQWEDVHVVLLLPPRWF